jgi:hypothetical protein
MTNSENISEKQQKHIVNPIALQNCSVKKGEVQSRVLDVSYLRLVIESNEPWLAVPDNENFPLEFHLDRCHFQAEVAVRNRGEGWLRLSFEKIVPSSRSLLRAFLCPKKVGESIVEDRRTDNFRHYHGLNESELWFNSDGGVLFTYLDQNDANAQFLIRMADGKSPLRVGKILRRDYIDLGNMTDDLPLIALSDRELYAKLGECRDIVTNFRPTAQVEYNLKQRLLKVISDNLYSTSHRVEMAPTVRPTRTSSLPAEN